MIEVNEILFIVIFLLAIIGLFVVVFIITRFVVCPLIDMWRNFKKYKEYYEIHNESEFEKWLKLKGNKEQNEIHKN